MSVMEKMCVNVSVNLNSLHKVVQYRSCEDMYRNDKVVLFCHCGFTGIFHTKRLTAVSL